MLNPHIGAIYLQKYKKYSEKVIIWMDFGCRANLI